MADMFEYSEEWKILVCRKCKVGVMWENMMGHLSGDAHKMKKREGEKVLKELEEKKYELYDKETFVKEVNVREVENEVVGLKEKVSGLRCVLDDCGFCCTGQNSMKNHWGKMHKEMLGEKGNRSKIELEEMKRERSGWMEKVWIQRIGDYAGLKSWFWVKGVNEEEKIMTIDEDMKKRLVTDLVRRRKKMDENREKMLIGLAKGSEEIPWLRVMKWDQFLKRMEGKCERKELVKLGEMVKKGEKNEEVLMLVWKSIERVLEMAEGLVDYLNNNVLGELMRSEVGERVDKRKMERYRDSTDIRSEGLVLKKMMMVLMRNEGEEGLLMNKFNDDEKTAFEEMMRYVEEVKSEGKDEEIKEGDWEREGRQRELKVKVFGLDLRVLRLIMAMVRRETQGFEYDMSLLCVLAVVGMRENGWVEPKNFSSTLSALIKCMRYMLLMESFQGELVVEKGELWKDGRKGVKLRDMVKKSMDECLIRGVDGPMTMVHDGRAYCMKISYETTPEGELIWRDDGEKVISGEMVFTMDGLRGLVGGLVNDGRSCLRKVVFGRDDGRDDMLPHIDWEKLRDDPTREGIGFSFVMYDKNEWEVDGETWLFDKLVGDGRVIGGDGVYDMKKIGRWLDLVVKLKEILLVLTHLSCGQPARGTELLTARWCSDGRSYGRNLFVEDGDVVIVIRDHKGRWKGSQKIILRYYPREVGGLIVWYVWLVVRCLGVFEEMWRKRNDVVSEMDREEEEESEEDEDEKRRKEGGEWVASSLLWGEDHNGRGYKYDGRLRRLLRTCFEEKLRVDGMGVLKWRHMMIGISRRHLFGGEGVEDDEEEDGEDDIMDEQAGHSSLVAQRVYGRMKGERIGEMASKRERFREISVKWHEFLKLTASMNERKRKRGSLVEERREKRRMGERRERVKNLDVDEVVRESNLGFDLYDRQREILNLMKKREGRVLGVLKTGSGKSLLFLFWGLVKEKGMTVVVVPLVVIKDDLLERGKKMNIEIGEWKKENPPHGKSVVVVVVETAMDDEDFGEFLRSVAREGMLERIVIDEVHVVMNKDEDFRPGLSKLGVLGFHMVPMLMVSGTVPVEMEGRMLDILLMKREDVKVVRGETRRSELIWRVYKMKEKRRQEKNEELVELLKGKMRKIDRWGGGSMLVYCSTIGDVKDLAEKLGGEIYTGNSKMKKGVLRWLKGGEMRGRVKGERVRVVVGTSAFGMGVDVGDLRVVVFAYEVEGFLEFIQGGGRAGRRGKKSEVVLIDGMKRMYRPPEKDRFRVKEEGWREMKMWRENETECRRLLMGKYMDGEMGELKCGEGDWKCDICGDEKDLEDDLEKERVVEVDDEGIEVGGGEEAQIEWEREREEKETMGREEREREGMKMREERSKEEERRRRLREEVEEKRRMEMKRVEEEKEKRGRKMERLVDDERREMGRLADGSKDMVWNEKKMVKKMLEWVKFYKGKCIVCMEYLGDERRKDCGERHTLRNCSHVGKMEEVRKFMSGMKNIVHEESAGCYDCGLWFGTCNKWVEERSEGKRDQAAGGGWWVRVNDKRGCDLSFFVWFCLGFVFMKDVKWMNEQKEELERMGVGSNGWQGGMVRREKFGGRQGLYGLVMLMKWLESGRGRTLVKEVKMKDEFDVDGLHLLKWLVKKYGVEYDPEYENSDDSSDEEEDEEEE